MSRRGVNGTATISLDVSECEKMLKVHEKSQAIGEFIDWLREEKNITLAQPDEEKNITLAQPDEGNYHPVYVPIATLLAEFFEIDLNKVDRERRAILDGLRAAHDSRG